MTILVVAAHPDDEVLGCGAAMARHAAAGDRVVCLILGEGAAARSAPDAAGVSAETEELARCARAAAEVLGVARLELAGLPDNRFDTVPLLDVVKRVEALMEEESPRVVYTHHPGDVNVDHVRTHHAVLAATRSLPGSPVRGLYFFEIASSSEWQTPAVATPFVPNHFVDATAVLDRKIEALRCYARELRPFPHPRSEEGVRALARWRGATIGREAAEAFVVGRQVVDG